MMEKRFNLAHRLIHWAIAFTVLFILLTIFLRLGWMNKDHMGVIIQESLTKSDIKVNKEVASTIGKDIRRAMWNWHIYAGYTMIGLYLIRMIITATQGIAYQNPFSKIATVKEKFKSWLYIIFYFFLAVSLFTGFMIVNGPKDLKGPLQSIHVKSLYYVITFIILHIGGVLIADAKEEKGIISKIISGDNRPC